MHFITLRRTWRFILAVTTILLAFGAIAVWGYLSIHTPIVAVQQKSDPHIRHYSESYVTFANKSLQLSVWYSASHHNTRPAIIMVHGGSWVLGERDKMTDWNKWFINHDYTVFDIDYRLPPGSTWQKAPGDVKCAIGWVKERAKRLNINKDKITLFGSSAGGNLSLLAGYTNNQQIAPSCEVQDTKVASVISVAGPTDMQAYFKYHSTDRAPNYPKNLRYITAFMGGTPKQFPKRYRDTSPLYYAHKDVPPTLLLYGTFDQLVPPSQSEVLADKLQKLGANAEATPLFGVTHGFEGDWKSYGTRMAQRSIADFLERQR